MKLYIRVVDQRTKSAGEFTYPYQHKVELEDFNRVDIDEAAASPAVIAGILRSVADELTAGQS